jgi:uncharacterized protein (DUF342 family)
MLDMDTIQELEAEYGKLANVPNDHPKLKKFRPEKKSKPKPKETTKMTETNNLGSLNNIMFDQLNRLNNQKLTKEELKEEIERSKAMAQVSTQIVNTGKLALDAERFKDRSMHANPSTPKMLEG